MRSAIVCLAVAFMVVGSAILYAQNNMPVMQTFIGQYGNAWLGRAMAALDFNTDGYDDLVVFTAKSSPNHFSAVNLYYGGAVIDTIPDLVWQSQFPYQISYGHILAAGDVNGDGYDDLMLNELYPTTMDSVMINFYYGGPNADLIPDHTLIIPFSNHAELNIRYAIGDVNYDGYDDFGCQSYDSNSNIPKLEILLGGIWQRVEVIGEGVSPQMDISVTGVGDVNGDEIDDFVVGYSSEITGGLESYRYLYFGANPLDLTNRILLYQTLSLNQIFSGAFGVGDFNQDGFDDFVYCTDNSWMDGNKLRLGGQNILETEEITLHSPTNYNLMDIGQTPPVWGDFNGDGYMDFAGSDYTESFWHGTAGIWLGKTNPNGIYDLRIINPPTSPYHQFGWDIAAGDFNGDGYDDLAISAPNSEDSEPFYPGYVYIFAGNAQLADTTVATDDPVQQDSTDTIEINYYPNPLSSSGHNLISYDLNGIINQTIGYASISLYNLKGQKVAEHTLTSYELLSKQGSIMTDNLVPGIYLAVCTLNGHVINCKKITIL